MIGPGSVEQSAYNLLEAKYEEPGIPIYSLHYHLVK